MHRIRFQIAEHLKRWTIRLHSFNLTIGRPTTYINLRIDDQRTSSAAVSVRFPCNNNPTIPPLRDESRSKAKASFLRAERHRRRAKRGQNGGKNDSMTENWHVRLHLTCHVTWKSDRWRMMSHRGSAAWTVRVPPGRLAFGQFCANLMVIWSVVGSEAVVIQQNGKWRAAFTWHPSARHARQQLNCRPRPRKQHAGRVSCRFSETVDSMGVRLWFLC